MKKSTWILILAVLVLGVVAWIVIGKDNGSTIKKELRDFAVQDTASVDKIFMVKKNNEQVTLTRNGDRWLVNERYVVRRDAIEILLKTLHRVRVKAPVSKSALNNVLTMMATRNTKVEVYSKNKLIKTLYVGGPTQDQMGTFMMLEGSSVPFVVSIPGFVGYLSTRFFTLEEDWRSPLIFDYNFNQIKSIKSTNYVSPEQSFVLNQGNEGFSMSRLQDGQQLEQMDTLAVKFFISSFERVASEFFANGLDQAIQDSLSQAQPFHGLEVAHINGTVTRVEMHRRPPGEQADPDAPVPEYDPERMWARVNDRDWVVVQYFVFDPLFKPFDFFRPVN